MPELLAGENPCGIKESRPIRSQLMRARSGLMRGPVTTYACESLIWPRIEVTTYAWMVVQDCAGGGRILRGAHCPFRCVEPGRPTEITLGRRKVRLIPFPASSVNFTLG